MAWVWYDRLDTSFAPAEFDFNSPINAIDAMSEVPLDTSRGLPEFRTRSKLAKFEVLHCPPTGSPPTVDNVWQEIILKCVPASAVQFYPIILVARDGISHKFSWVLPFSRVRCIDPERSDVISKVEKPNIKFVISCNFYVHHPNCLGNYHLARDEQNLTHIVVSDALQNALAATGESSMFFQPEDVPTIGKREIH